jgi:hypothetical protein
MMSHRCRSVSRFLLREPQSANLPLRSGLSAPGGMGMLAERF